VQRPPFNRLRLPIFKFSPMTACRHCLEKILFYATGGILIRTSMWKTYYRKEDIPRAYIFYTCYSLLTVIMCNLGPGHNNEVVGHEDSYA